MDTQTEDRLVICGAISDLKSNWRSYDDGWLADGMHSDSERPLNKNINVTRMSLV